MESVPVGTDSPSLPFVHSLRLGCRSQGDAHGIRSRRNGFPFPALRALLPFRLPQLGRRSWNPFPWNAFPSPAVFAFPPFGLPQFGRRSWNPFPSERIPLPCRSCAPPVWAAAVKATLMESVPVGTDSPFPAARALLPFRLPQSRRRSWNPFPWNGFPFPAARALLPFGLPQSRRRSWNPFPSERIPLPCPSCIPSVWAATVRATLMESVPVGTDSPSPAVSASPPFRLPQSGQRTTGKTVPKDGLSHERTLCAEYFARCGERLFFYLG